MKDLVGGILKEVLTSTISSEVPKANMRAGIIQSRYLRVWNAGNAEAVNVTLEFEGCNWESMFSINDRFMPNESQDIDMAFTDVDDSAGTVIILWTDESGDGENQFRLNVE